MLAHPQPHLCLPAALSASSPAGSLRVNPSSKLNLAGTIDMSNTSYLTSTNVTATWQVRRKAWGWGSIHHCSHSHVHHTWDYMCKPRRGGPLKPLVTCRGSYARTAAPWLTAPPCLSQLLAGSFVGGAGLASVTKTATSVTFSAAAYAAKVRLGGTTGHDARGMLAPPLWAGRGCSTAATVSHARCCTHFVARPRSTPSPWSSTPARCSATPPTRCGCAGEPRHESEG